MDAMWLQYGYSPDELKDSSLLAHPRIQIILRHDHIGIWLIVGKNSSSIHERKNLAEHLQNDLGFRELFFQQLKSLGGSYWVQPGGENPKQISEIESADLMNDFLQDEDMSDYFIIGRTYESSDQSLSEEHISETVLLEFQRLYPLYLSIKINSK